MVFLKEFKKNHQTTKNHEKLKQHADDCHVITESVIHATVIEFTKLIVKKQKNAHQSKYEHSIKIPYSWSPMYPKFNSNEIVLQTTRKPNLLCFYGSFFFFFF